MQQFCRSAAEHRDPIRIYVNTDGSIEFPQPEEVEENPSAPNFGQTVRTTKYKNAQFEVAFLCGASGYDLVDVGAPPSDFTSTSPDHITKLRWNGKPFVTDKILVPCPAGGNPTP